MNSRILALLAASLFLTGCGSTTNEQPAAAAPLPMADVGAMRTSNEYWNAQRPYAWDDGSTGATSSTGSLSNSSSRGSSLSSSSSSSTEGSGGTGMPSDGRGWLARVGMAPQWGPDGHAQGDRNPGQLPAEEGFMPENFQYAYDNDFGFVAVDEEEAEGGTGTSSSSRGASNGGSNSSSSGGSSGGGLRLPSGRTVGGQSSNGSTSSTGGQGVLRLPSGRTVDGQSNSSSSGGGNGTITLPSGRVIDGESDEQAMNGSGSTVRLASGGGRGCNQPDQGEVTSGEPGVTFPVLYKGNCPVSTSILRVPEKEGSTFGSMDF